MRLATYTPVKSSASEAELTELKSLYPNGISASVVNNAWQNIQEFYEYWSIPDFKEQMWELLKNAIGNDNGETTGLDRVNHLYIYERVCAIVDDLHHIYIHELLSRDRERKE